jgi:hypothetical protein
MEIKELKKEENLKKYLKLLRKIKMPNTKHFSKLTTSQLWAIIEKTKQECRNCATFYKVGRLSHLGIHNVYEAIEYAILSQWLLSKYNMNKLKSKLKSEEKQHANTN